MVERPLHGVVIIVGRDQVIAPENFLGLAVRSVGHLGATDHLANIFRQPMCAPKIASVGGFLAPRNVLLQGLLHFFRAERHPVGGIVIQKQKIVRHRLSSHLTRVYCEVSVNFGLPFSYSVQAVVKWSLSTSL